MSSPEAPQPPPGVLIAALVRVGHEVALRARRLGALSLCAEIRAWDGSPLLFSYRGGRVWATGRGYELELSARPEWRSDRPPGT